MVSNFDKDPAILIDRRQGTESSPFVEMNETLSINTEGKVILSEIPLKYERVQIFYGEVQWYEIEDGVPSPNQFKVDYVNKILTFNTVNNGKQVNAIYKGTGNHYYSVGSIYTEQKNGKVTETLKDLAEENKKANAHEVIRKENEVARKNSEATRESNETTRKSNESARVSAETLRKNAETSRVSVESARVTDENLRKSNESARILSEDERKSSETNRNSSESTRVSNEDSRKLAETARANEEASRQSAESSRVLVEDKRVFDESARTSAEGVRNTNEDARKLSESDRELGETERLSSEANRKLSETERKDSEVNRKSVESSRVIEEGVRKTAEGVRSSNEATRKTNETARVSAEGLRSTAETGRVDAETSRASKDSARDSSEATRKLNETARESAEGLRVSAETTRKASEDARVLDESARKVSETNRESAELGRNNAESARALSETERKDSETSRKLAETKRQEDTATAINRAIATSDTLQSVADNVEFKGAYNPVTQYYKNNTVSLNGSSYIALQDTLGKSPDEVDSLYWGMVAQRGVDGEGSVGSVNNIFPNIVGNVTITPSDIGASPANHTHTIANIDGLQASLDSKVSVVAGKGLSDSNFTSAEKTKLSEIAPNANNYVHPANHPASMITESTTKRFVADAKIAEWDGKETVTGSQAKVNLHAEDNSKHLTLKEKKSISITVSPTQPPEGMWYKEI